MYQAEITDKEAGQRFDKYLHRILPNAGNSFLYKMLRKKNIKLNDRKADG
ncbi:MAG: RluA family pseudouridine synthase, partial [Eubacterium sp.]|nr:RluA family pseudouridine synthase [Eubacterium sp.]